MNLEELQIKISIELKELEKQLKSITKSIDKTLGPKTTKKLMQDNHRVIKAESIAINKTLNKAFEVDYKSFNNNLNAAMNQAKLTVRSACNDIRRELNSALNVKANIRVTGKTSIDSSITGSSGSTTASSMVSSQYIGAMIIKATNTIIKANNTNTAKLEQAINNLAKKLGSTTKKTKPVTKTGSNNTQVNVPEITVKPEIKEVIVKPEVIVEGTSVSTGKDIYQIIKEMDNNTKKIVAAIKSIGNNFDGDDPTGDRVKTPKKPNNNGPVADEIKVSAEEKIKKPFTGSIDKIFAGALEKTKEETEKLNKQLEGLSKVFAGATNKVKEEAEKINEQLDGLFKPFVGSLEKTKTQKEKSDEMTEKVNAMKKTASGESDSKSLASLIAELISVQFEPIIKDLTDSIKSPAYDHMQKIKEQMNKQLEIAEKNLGKALGGESEEEPIDIDEEVHDTAVDAFNKQAQAIKEAWAKASDPEQLEKDLENIIDTVKIVKGIANPINEFFADLGAIIVRELANSIKSPIYDHMQEMKKRMEDGLKGVIPKQKPKKEEAKDTTPKPVIEVDDFVVKDDELEEQINEAAEKIQEQLPINIETTEAKEKLERLDKIVEKLRERLADIVNVESDLNIPGSHVINKGNKLIEGTGPLTSNLDMNPTKTSDEEVEITIDVTKTEKELNKLKNVISDIIYALDGLNGSDDLDNFNKTIKNCKKALEEVIKTCKGDLKNSIKEIGELEDVDTSDYDTLVNKLKGIENIARQLGIHIRKNLKFGTLIDKEALNSSFRALNDLGNVSFGDSDDDSLGFLPYKQQLDKIVEYAKKVGAKIKEALFGFFKKEKPLENNFDLSMPSDNNYTSKEKISAFQEKELQRWINAQRAAEEQIRAFQEQTRQRWYDMLIERNRLEQKLQQPFAGSLKKPGGDDDELAMTIDESSFRKLIEKAKEIGEKIKKALFNSDSQVLGFAPYQNELHKLGELANRIGAKIKTAFSGTTNFFGNFDSHVAVHQMGELKAKLSEIKAKYKETISGINDVASKLTAPFRKTADILKNFAGNIGKGLNGAKKALSSFANASKSLWSKITGIFKKGSKDCEKSISPLKSSFSSLVGSFASMFGLYQLGSIFVDGTKQAMKYEASLMTIQRTLGGASKTLIDFANSNAQAFGINKSQVMEFGNIYSVIVSNFEKDATKAADITKGLLQSAGIIAGATGYDVNQVLENLRSGILGSSEAVDQLGLNLKTAQLAAAAGVKSWDDLTEAQKQAIIVQEILNQTTAKYGGIVKNTSSMHNAFMAQLSNTKLALGQLGKALYTAVLPALTTIMAVLEKVFSFAAKAVAGFLSLFGITVDFTSNMQGIDSSIDTSVGDDVSDSLDNATDSANDATEAVEKFKGSLAGFDEINTLTDNTSKDDGSGDGGNADIPGVSGGEIGLPEIGESDSVFDKIGDKMKAFMDEILEPFKNAWDLLGDRWKAAWADLKDSFKNFCDSLANFLKSVWEHGKRFSAVSKPRKIGRTLIIIKTHILDIKEMISCKKYGKISKDMKDSIKYLIWVK